jgi:hypothetical protein
MKYLISYRQQLKITPAPPPAAAGLAFVSGVVVVVGRGASRPSAQSFAAPRVRIYHTKSASFLAKGSRCELKRTGQAASKSAAGFLSN